MATSRSSLRLVQLTPPGRGAVATLRVEGPGAVAALESRVQTSTGRRLRDSPLGRLVFGRFSLFATDPEGPPVFEEVILRRFADEAVELHSHGGPAVMAMIQASLAPATVTPWQEWVASGHADPIASAAIVALARAPTERTAAILLDQFHGALRQATERIDAMIRAGAAGAARHDLEVLLARVELGRHLVEPWRVVLAGPPNAGKSSLANALLGYRRAIVHATPGTTRDVVAARTAIDGWPVELRDTAGIREAESRVEGAGIDRAKEEMQQADLVLLVFDRRRRWSLSDQELWESQPTGLVVHNKLDASLTEDSNRPVGLSVSALTGVGIDQLLAAIAARLVPEPPPPGTAVPFAEPQIASLRQRISSLGREPPAV